MKAKPADIDSSVSQTATHWLKGANGRYYKSREDSDRYAKLRALRTKARRYGFGTDDDSIQEFLRWEEKFLTPKKPVSAKAKVQAVRQLMERDNLTMTEFASRVIKIMEKP